jgi:transcriptional regulator GlxA family with amidase domain
MPPYRRIVAYAPQGVTVLSLGIISAIFAARPELPAFELTVCTHPAGQLRTDLGTTLAATGDFQRIAPHADLILPLPGSGYRAPAPPEVLEALLTAHARGATIAAHCTGTFLLAETGLLDNLEATTHWRFADELAAAYPDVRVRPDALYIDQGQIITGAGAAAGIDMSLHVIRRAYGAAVANQIARDLVTPPHRPGGQAQYISAPLAPDNGSHLSMAAVIDWAREHLADNPTVDQLADRAAMSRRSFIRHFKAATGSPPHAWLRAQRLNQAEELLERTDLPIERIAHRVGYASATVLREQFTRHRGLAPRDYRRTFSDTARPALRALNSSTGTAGEAERRR